MKASAPKLMLVFGGLAGVALLMLFIMARSVGLFPERSDDAQAEQGDYVLRNDPLITYVPDEENPGKYQTYSEPVQTVYSPEFGPKDAPVEIFMFGDYECIACREFGAEIAQVFQAFPDQIHYVWKDFPIPKVHLNSVNAAEAARCANEQGKYWEMHDRLFLNQHSLGEDLYIELAEEIGLNMESFEACRGADKYPRFIEQDFLEGKTLGVSETPTIFINNVMYTGRMDAPSIKAHIQQILDGENSQN